MNPRSRASILMALVAAACSAHALDCKGDRFHAATTLAGLPGDVRGLLQEKGPVADRGQPYQRADVVEIPGVPRGRLALAAVSGRRVVAALRSRLAKLQGAIPEGNPGLALVNEYLKVLDVDPH